MNIEKLTLLKKYLSGPGLNPVGMSVPEIEALEVEFCATGEHFQKALKEFLFLTGKQCAHFASGVGTTPNYNAVQQNRLSLIAGLSYTFSYSNIWSFGYQTDDDYFYFIDLNEDSDDPDVYFTGLNHNEYETGTASEYVIKTQYKFSNFVEASINYYLANNDFFPH